MAAICALSSPIESIASETEGNAVDGETFYGQLLDEKAAENETPAAGYDDLNGFWQEF